MGQPGQLWWNLERSADFIRLFSARKMCQKECQNICQNHGRQVWQYFCDGGDHSGSFEAPWCDTKWSMIRPPFLRGPAWSRRNFVDSWRAHGCPNSLALGCSHPSTYKKRCLNGEKQHGLDSFIGVIIPLHNIIDIIGHSKIPRSETTHVSSMPQPRASKRTKVSICSERFWAPTEPRIESKHCSAAMCAALLPTWPM